MELATDRRVRANDFIDVLIISVAARQRHPREVKAMRSAAPVRFTEIPFG